MGTFPIIVFLICFVFVYGQTSPKICWDKTWFNTSATTQANRSEYEQPSTQTLSSICTNGQVIAARCKDSKGEGFTGYKNDSASHFFATCNITKGLICHPYNNSTGICEDFLIQYGCACPTEFTTISNENGGNGNSSSTGTTNEQGGNKSGQKIGQGGNNGPSYRISKFILLSLVVLTIFC